MKLIYTIDINSTPENVFSWIGNPEKALVWQTSVAGGEIINETPDMIGTTFRETVAENGRGVEMRGIVTDYRENQAMAMHLESKYNIVDVDYRIEEIEGCTRVTMSSNIRFKSFLKIMSIILWPAFKKKTLKQLDGEYARLKELCEQGA